MSTLDDDEAAATPDPRRDPFLDRTATDGAGAFWRDRDGIWRYAADGSPVPHARDRTLADLYDPPLVHIDDAATPTAAVRLVPRSWARRHPDHPLAWVFDHAELGGRGPVPVPASVWEERSVDVVAMDAPELHPLHLLGVDGVAEAAAVSEPTVRSYLARGQMPAPIARVGGSPLWTRPVIERWLASRRRWRRAGDDAADAQLPAGAADG